MAAVIAVSSSHELGHKICYTANVLSTTQHIGKINREVRSCLDKIEPGRSFVVHLADTLTRLRADPSWTRAEILEVEVGVRRILSHLVSDEDWTDG